MIDHPATINSTVTMPTVPAVKPSTLQALIIERVELAVAVRGMERLTWLILATLGVLTLIEAVQLWLIAFLLGHVR